MKKPLLLWGLAGGVAISLGYFALPHRSKRYPEIAVPDTIEAGPQKIGDWLHVELPIQNNGGSELVISSFENSCGCLILGGDGASGWKRNDRISIEPGGTLRAQIQMNVRGRVGTAFSGLVRFSTNDPNHPHVRVQITAQLKGRLFTAPGEIYVGPLMPSEHATRDIEFRLIGDDSDEGLGTIECHPSHLIHVERVRKKHEPLHLNGEIFARTIAQVQIGIRAPKEPGTVHGTITARGKEDNTVLVVVPVQLMVQPRIQVIPGAVVLPRVSGDTISDTVKCLCRSSDGIAFRLQPDDVPTGVDLSLSEGSAEKEVHFITIKWSGKYATAPGGPIERIVRLCAKSPGRNEPVEIRVTWQP